VEKKYYWLKLDDNFFKSLEIKKLRKIAGGDTYTIIYLKMLLLAIQQNGKLYYEGIEENFLEEIALSLDESVDDVEVTMQFLISKGLAELVGEDKYEYMLTQCEEMVGSETDAARRQRRSRSRKKLQEQAADTIGIKETPVIEEKKKKSAAYTTDFEELWANYPRKADKGACYKKYKARLNDGYSPEQLLVAVQNYRAYIEKNHTEERFIKHGKTFFSDTLPFLDFVPKEPQIERNEVTDDNANPFLSEKR
jgi:predicted phage replisome organizer